MHVCVASPPREERAEFGRAECAFTSRVLLGGFRGGRFYGTGNYGGGGLGLVLIVVLILVVLGKL